jgi:hypothetical protein
MGSDARGFETRLWGRAMTGWSARSRVGVVVVGALLLGAWGAGSARADSYSALYRVLPASPSGIATKAVSCPSATQCTAVGPGANYGSAAAGQEATFDPATQTVNAAGVASVAPGAGSLVDVSCPSVTQCTAIGGGNLEVTFDPTTGQNTAAGVVNLTQGYQGAQGEGGLENVSCPSTTQCTATGLNEITFDPTTGQVNAAGVQPMGNFAAGPVSCPSVSQCTTVTGVMGNASTVLTFDPVTGANPADRKKVGSTVYFPGVSCPSVTQCTAATTLNSSGLVTFDPTTATPNAAGSVPIAPDGLAEFETVGVSCPSVAQCTEVGIGAPSLTSRTRFLTSVTVNPASPAGNSPTYGQVIHELPTAVDCSSVSRCVALFQSGLAVTITPSVSGGGGAARGAAVSLHGSPSGSGGVVKVALGCAASSSGCRVTSSLTSTEMVRGGKVLGVSAAVTRHRTVSLGTRRVTIAAGKTATVTVALNATGRRLLSRFHRLPVRLRIAVAGEKGSTTRNVTVRPGR